MSYIYWIFWLLPLSALVWGGFSYEDLEAGLLMLAVAYAALPAATVAASHPEPFRARTLRNFFVLVIAIALVLALCWLTPFFYAGGWQRASTMATILSVGVLLTLSGAFASALLRLWDEPSLLRLLRQPQVRGSDLAWGWGFAALAGVGFLLRLEEPTAISASLWWLTAIVTSGIVAGRRPSEDAETVVMAPPPRQNVSRPPLSLVPPEETESRRRQLIADYSSPLMRAAASCDIRGLEKHFRSDIPQAEHSTPLTAALRSQHPRRLDAMRWLLAAGAEINGPDSKGNRPLHHACMEGDKVVLEFLVEQGADTEAVNEEGFTPLGVACRQGAWLLAELLLRAGGSLAPARAIPPLHAAAQVRQDDPTGVELLLGAGADPETPGRLGRTALMEAAMAGNARIADSLLHHGAHVDSRDQLGNTALMEAVRAGANGVLKKFVFWKPQTELRDRPGRTALLIAVGARRADADTIRLLLSLGADARAKNKEGREASELAIAAGRWQLARVLGKDFNVARRDFEVDEIDLRSFETTDDLRWFETRFAQSAAAPVSKERPKEVPREHREVVVADLFETAPVVTVDESPSEADVMLDEGPDIDADPDLVASVPGADPRADHEDACPAATAGDPGDAKGSVQALSEPAQEEEPTLGDGSEVVPSDPVRAVLHALNMGYTDRIPALLAVRKDWPEWLLVSSFLHAAVRNDLDLAKHLLSAGLSPNATSESNQTLFVCVAQQAPTRLQMLNALLDHGARFSAEDGAVLWLLGVADEQHDRRALPPEQEPDLLRIIERMLDNGASLAVRDAEGRTALHVAALHRTPKALQFLVEHGHEIEVRDALLRTPLHLVCEFEPADAPAMARVLIRAGADPRATDDSGRTPMSLATQRQSEALLKQLMMAGQRAPTKNVTLLDAAVSGEAATVERLLRGGADFSERDSSGATPLIRAAGAGHVRIVQSLLDAGAATDAAARNGMTALGAAALAGQDDVVVLLIETGVHPDQLQDFAVTPLMYAAARWRVACVRKLVQAGADVNHADEAERTALMAAVQRVGNEGGSAQAALQTVRALLNAGASVNAVNDDGQSVLMLLLGVRATGHGKIDESLVTKLVQLLVLANAELDSQDLTGWTALHAAAAHGLFEPTKLMLRAGANRRIRDINGLSPCDLAMDNGNHRLVDLFLESRSPSTGVAR